MVKNTFFITKLVSGAARTPTPADDSDVQRLIWPFLGSVCRLDLTACILDSETDHWECDMREPMGNLLGSAHMAMSGT